MSSLPKENLVRRRDQVLQDTLASTVYVDVLHFDNSIPLFFAPYDDENEDAPCDGTMNIVPPPSVELEVSAKVKGLIHVNVLPRTLPISSTHAGREWAGRDGRCGAARRGCGGDRPLPLQ
jgi:hypothetical protein